MFSTLSTLSRSMATAASAFDGPVDVGELLQLICLAAIDAVPGAEYAGITLADRHGKLRDPRRGEPPARPSSRRAAIPVQAGSLRRRVQGGGRARSDDLSVDVRWPEYGPLAADLGIVSQMGIELFDEPGLIAGLNLLLLDRRRFRRRHRRGRHAVRHPGHPRPGPGHDPKAAHRRR